MTHSIIKAFLAFSCLISSSLALSSYPIHGYELVVVESLPENINLNMRLSQIEDAKKQSKLQRNKTRIINLLSEKLAPLMGQFSQSYNLLEFAQNIPGEEIINELVAAGRADKKVASPSDFVAIILPTQPLSAEDNKKLPYASLYSKTKLSVIDAKNTPFQATASFEDVINQRVVDAIHFAYNRNYVDFNNDSVFFTGALVHIHLSGVNSSAKVQLLAGLPTETSFPFVQKEKEVEFSQIRLPDTPELKRFSDRYTDHPGVIVSVNYKRGESPKAKLQFGSLALMRDGEWKLSDDAFDQAWYSNDSLTVANYFKDYNTPYLFGDYAKPLGDVHDLDSFGDRTKKNFANWWLKRNFHAQINIHEVELDLKSLQLIDMKTMIEFRKKENILGGFVPPAVEMASISDQFLEKGNEKIEAQLEPVKRVHKQILRDGLAKTLSQPEVREKLMDLFFQILDSRNGDATQEAQ